jgi:hypothetical protein
MRRSIDHAGELARRDLATALPDGDRLDALHGREPPVNSLWRFAGSGGLFGWTLVHLSVSF